MISDQDTSKEVSSLNVYERLLNKYISRDVDVEHEIIQCDDSPEEIARRLNAEGSSRLFVHPGHIRSMRRLYEWVKDVDHIANLDIDHKFFSKLFRMGLESISEIEDGLKSQGEVFLTCHRNVGVKTYVEVVKAIQKYREGEILENVS